MPHRKEHGRVVLVGGRIVPLGTPSVQGPLSGLPIREGNSRVLLWFGSVLFCSVLFCSVLFCSVGREGGEKRWFLAEPWFLGGRNTFTIRKGGGQNLGQPKNLGQPWSARMVAKRMSLRSGSQGTPDLGPDQNSFFHVPLPKPWTIAPSSWRPPHRPQGG